MLTPWGPTGPNGGDGMPPPSLVRWGGAAVMDTFGSWTLGSASIPASDFDKYCVEMDHIEQCTDSQEGGGIKIYQGS